MRRQQREDVAEARGGVCEAAGIEGGLGVRVGLGDLGLRLPPPDVGIERDEPWRDFRLGQAVRGIASGQRLQHLRHLGHASEGQQAERAVDVSLVACGAAVQRRQQREGLVVLGGDVGGLDRGERVVLGGVECNRLQHHRNGDRKRQNGMHGSEHADTIVHNRAVQYNTRDGALARPASERFDAPAYRQ